MCVPVQHAACHQARRTNDRPLTRCRVLAAMAASALAACGGEWGGVSPGTAANDLAEAHPVAGTTHDAFFYPEFQRWKVIDVKPAAGAQIPVDLRGIPAILRGRYLYLGPSYMSIPFVNSGGDVLQPACFQRDEDGLTVQAVTARTVPATRWELFDDRTLRMAFGEFELTLARSDLPQDDGYQRRLFDSYYNQSLERERQNGAKSGCRLQPTELPRLEHHDLELLSPESGERVVVRAGDRDPWTPIHFDSLSHESRQPLDQSDPANVIAGCSGRQRVTRLMSGEAGDAPPPSSYFIIRSLIGQAADGELCERTVFLRRIPPESVVELLGIGGYGATVPGQRLPMKLVAWEADDVFLAEIAGSLVEVTVREQPQVLLRLKLRPDVSEAVSRTQSAPAGSGNRLPVAVASPEATRGALAEPSASMPGKLHKWVAKDGTVTYSDRPPPN